MSARSSRAGVGQLARLVLAGALLGSSAVLVLPAAPALADASAVTVPGPTSEPGSSVTVDKTTDLRNEVVTVSWEGFRPSVNSVTQPLPGFATGTTRFPVRVYQCRGTDPAAPGDCYGSAIYEFPGRPEPIIANGNESQPDGPANWTQTSTAPDGTGVLDVEVRTAVESSTLGCTEQTPCSLVVVMNPGHPTAKDPREPSFPACATVFDTSSSDLCLGSQAPGAVWPERLDANTIDAPWAWDNRVVVPLSFASSAATCPLGDSDLRVIGSPKAQRAVASWQPATCQLADPLKIDYTAQGEPLARSAFLNGTAQVAMTNRGLDPVAAADRAFAYAPISTSGIVVAFRVDDSVTGRPITTMQLTPRLVAKLITASYGLQSFAPEGATYGDPAVQGNPATMFQDPEFLALNDLGPGHGWVADNQAAPLLLSDLTDVTYELTRWLQEDPATRSFLAGDEDEWGMSVNDNYVGTVFPVEAFELRDQYEKMALQFQPVQGLSTVAQKLVSNSYAGTTDQVVQGNYVKFGEGSGLGTVGRRSFVAIIDSANAAALRLPVARIANAAGQFVGPTTDAMAAAVDAMTVNADGTRSADVASTDPEAYPLTMIDYAVVPTTGLDADTAEAAGQFLDYASGPGQVSGLETGQLPGGYVPLDADLVAETRAAAAAVRAQDGATAPVPTPTTPAAPTTGGPAGGGASSTGGGSGGTLPGGGTVPGGGAVPGVAIPPGSTTGPALPGDPTTSAVAHGLPALDPLRPARRPRGRPRRGADRDGRVDVPGPGAADPAVAPAPSPADRRVTTTLPRPADPVATVAVTRPEPQPAVLASTVVPPARPRSTFRIGTSLLLLAGLLLGFMGYLFVLGPVQQSRTQHTLYESLAGELALAVTPIAGVIEPGEPIGVLELPTLGVAQVVVEGTTSGQLMKGPGHRRDTVLPGQAGVSVVQGRSGLFGGPFARIGELLPGDPIVVTTGQGRVDFVVASLRDSTMDIPPPSAAEAVLNLVTASPAFGPDRNLIVSADLVSPTQGGAPAYAVVADSERALAGDPGAALPLMLWGQVLLLVLVAATWAYQRWDPWPTYLLSTPILLAVLWNVYENAAQLLPNTM